jgi:hypothetical protein
MLANEKDSPWTKVENVYPYTQAAREIAESLGWDEPLNEKLTLQMLRAIRSGKLLARDKVTGRYVAPRDDLPIRFVHIQDVNDWLATEGHEYRWNRQIVAITTTPAQLEGTRASPLEEKNAVNKQWSVKPMKRKDNLRAALAIDLNAADKSLPPPTAREIIARWQSHKPMGILKMTSDSVDFLRSDGSEESLTLDALAERIQRLIIR